MRKGSISLVTALAAALAAGPVLAQGVGGAGANTGNAMGASGATNTTANNNGPNGVMPQARGQWRASKINGLSVYNRDNQQLGTVDDVILSQNGQVESVVLSVGGFLGIGDHLVAVPFNQLQFVYKGNNGNFVTADGQPVQLAGNNNNAGANNAAGVTTTTAGTAGTVAPGGASTVASTNNPGSPNAAGHTTATGVGIGAAVNNAGAAAATTAGNAVNATGNAVAGAGNAMATAGAGMANNAAGNATGVGGAGNNANQLIGTPDRAILNANKDQLKSLPQFKYAS